MSCLGSAASTILQDYPGPMPKLKRSDTDERATDWVESLDRGLRLLQNFGTTTGPMTLSDLARAADLPRATARRMLFTLQRGGFVSGDGKLFSLTPHVLTLAGAYLRSNQVVAVLQPVLDRVAIAANEISSLAVLDGDEVVFIARSSPARMFSGGLEIGYRLPAFCTSVGRVMLGQLDGAGLAGEKVFSVPGDEARKIDSHGSLSLHRGYVTPFPSPASPARRASSAARR